MNIGGGLGIPYYADQVTLEKCKDTVELFYSVVCFRNE